MWRRQNIGLPTEGRVYCSAVHSIQLDGCKALLLRLEDICRLLAFDRRCSRSIALVFWDHRVRNVMARNRKLGKYDKSVGEVVSVDQLS